MKLQAKTDLIHVSHGKPFTDSIVIAEQFGKRHDNITVKIQSGLTNPDKEIRDFSLLNFKERKSLDSRGKPQVTYEITEDGFLELGMGFTGDKAKKVRIRFIAEFRKAIDEINRLYSEPTRTIAIKDKRAAYFPAMDALKEMRENQVAKKHSYKAITVILADIDNATSVETMIGKLGVHPDIKGIDGSTEFRAFTPAELYQALDLIKQHAGG